MHRTMGTTTRRSLVRGGLLLSLAAVPPLRPLLVKDVAADKNTGKKPVSIKARVATQRQLCEVIGGGTFSARKTPFGSTITTCTGGDKMSDGLTCVNTKKSTTCSQSAPPPQPSLPDLTPDPGTPPFTFTDPGDVPDVPLEPDDGEITVTASPDERHHRATRHRTHGKGHQHTR